MFAGDTCFLDKDGNFTRCFSFSKEAKTWTDAMESCHARGGTMAVMKRWEEMIIVRKVERRRAIIFNVVQIDH